MARRQCDQLVHDPCGVDRDIGFDSESDGWLEVDDSLVCVACAALEQYQKEHEKSPPEPGTVLRVIDTRKPTEHKHR